MEARGRVNCYTCESCRKRLFTVNLNAGVTPFLCGCPHCKGLCQSSFYRLPANVERVEVSHAWIRPTADEFAKLPRKTQLHVLSAGLVRRPLAQARPIIDDIDPTVSSDVDRWLTFAAHAYEPAADLWQQVVSRFKPNDSK